MNLWEAVQPWIDPLTGLLTAPDGGRDNLILLTAYLSRELERSNADPLFPRELSQSICNFFLTTRVVQGLYRRSPGNTDDNSIDNLIGACYLGPVQARGIRSRWNNYFSCFDVNNPTKVMLNKNFYGRFIGVKAYIVASGGEKPWLIQRLLWCLSVYFSVKTSKGSSDPLLLSLQVDTMDKFCPRTAAYWRKHYSLYELYSEYFGPTHPITLSRKP